MEISSIELFRIQQQKKRQELLAIGFKEISHFTVMRCLEYDLGRNRHLSFGCIGTPNEILFISEVSDTNDKEVTEVIVLRNYDYDGYTSVETVKSIITSITNRKF
jgi:hypothetical protein